MSRTVGLFHRKDIVEMAKIVSLETGISYPVILEAYRSYWDLIKETIGSYDLLSVQTEDDLVNIQKGFNVKHIGKLQTNLNTIIAVNKRIKNKHESTEH